jgi:hypothetical protein
VIGSENRATTFRTAICIRNCRGRCVLWVGPLQSTGLGRRVRPFRRVDRGHRLCVRLHFRTTDLRSRAARSRACGRPKREPSEFLLRRTRANDATSRGATRRAQPPGAGRGCGTDRGATARPCASAPRRRRRRGRVRRTAGCRQRTHSAPRRGPGAGAASSGAGSGPAAEALRAALLSPGADLLQRELRSLLAPRGRMYPTGVRHPVRRDERHLRQEYVQRRPGLLQRELRHVRGSGSNLRHAALYRPHDPVSRQRGVRDGDLQRGLRVLQPELRHVCAARASVLEESMLKEMQLSFSTLRCSPRGVCLVPSPRVDR